VIRGILSSQEFDVTWIMVVSARAETFSPRIVMNDIINEINKVFFMAVIPPLFGCRSGLLVMNMNFLIANSRDSDPFYPVTG